MNFTNRYGFLAALLLFPFLAFAADEVEMDPDGPRSVPIRPQTGKILYCPTYGVMKKDFLKQLQTHEIYGEPEKITRLSPAMGRAAQFYQEKMARNFSSKSGPNLTPNLFKNLTTQKLFDGSFVLNSDQPMSNVPQPGDVLLNMAFANPWMVGSFYSKRGMEHARIVVAVEGNDKARELVVLDGGWEKFSRLHQIHSQTLWLRPRAKYFDAADRARLIRWARVMEPVPYDNMLVDDLAKYRKLMHDNIDRYTQDANGDGQPDMDPRSAQLRARSEALMASDPHAQNFAPFGNADTFIPSSGNYCSEAGTHIFSYLGFRQFGETAFSLLTAFSSTGNLPNWAIYANALTGFGASVGPVFEMHKDFFEFFSVMDEAWKKRILPFPSTYTEDTYNFSKVMRANQDEAVRLSLSGRDLLKEQIERISQSTDTELSTRAVTLDEGLNETLGQLREHRQSPDLSFSEAIDDMYFRNLSYGPHHFLENGEYFELKGAFFNSDLESGYQAKWIANAGRGRANLSTTLYSLDSFGAGEPTDESCQITGKPAEPMDSMP